MTDYDFFNDRYYYDAATGYLHHKKATRGHGRAIHPGDVAGSIQGGRVLISVRRDGKQRVYKGHRVIWLLMTGCWPSGEIDHIDTDPTNNKWQNLRIATRSQQNMNRNSTSKTGYKGVTKHGSGYRAQIELDDMHRCLGTYTTPEEANATYGAAAEKLFGEFARY